MVDVGVDALNVITAVGAFAAAAIERDVQHSGSIGKLAVGSCELTSQRDAVQSLAQARRIIEHWRIDYNGQRPHTDLNGLATRSITNHNQNGLYL